MTGTDPDDVPALVPPSRSKGSIHDVARVAGVGVVTVSRVVNGRSGVSPEMRAYVQEVIQRLNYVPKAPERRPGRKLKEEVVTPEQPPRTLDLYITYPLKLGEFPFRAPIYSRMLDELEGAAERRGIDLYVRQGKVPLPEPIAGTLMGHILFGRGEWDWSPDEPGLALSGLPRVWVMGGDTADFPGDSVRVDHERIGELAAQHLYRIGHRHACYLGTTSGYSDKSFGLRSDVFAWHFQRRGGTPHLVIEPGIIDHAQGHNAVDEAVLARSLDRCLALTPRPTVIFLEFAMFAPAVWRILEARGLRPGIDVEFLVCNNDGIYLDRLKPRPMVLDIPCRAMADLTLDLLLNSPRQRTLPPMRYLVAPELIR